MLKFTNVNIWLSRLCLRLSEYYYYAIHWARISHRTAAVMSSVVHSNKEVALRANEKRSQSTPVLKEEHDNYDQTAPLGVRQPNS